MARARFLLAVAAGVLGCRFATEPRLPDGAMSMAPQPEYALWWELTESCSGRMGELSNVRWYFVPGTKTIEVGRQEVQGYWSPNRIVLAGNSIQNGALVRHEMLHALSGDGGHAREYFVKRCGGVVACESECAKEAGEPDVPASSAREVLTGDVLTRLDVQRTAPSMATDSGWIAMSVRVTNPRSIPVWVRLAPVAPEELSYSPTFGFIVDCIRPCGGGTGWSYEFLHGNRFGLTSGATRVVVFDRRLGLGSYSIRGTFNSDTTPAVKLTVKP